MEVDILALGNRRSLGRIKSAGGARDGRPYRRFREVVLVVQRTSDIPVPRGLADLTADWLGSALGAAGKVLDVSAEPIGTGQIADSARLALTWEPPAAGPTSLVAKVTAASEASRQAGMTTRTYEVEVGFYSDLAGSLPVRTPRCYWAGFDPERSAYGVLLEDVAPAHQGDQLAGCSVDEAAAALEELALLHAPRWGDPDLCSLRWVREGGRDRGSGLGEILNLLLPGFLERYQTRLSPEVVELIPRFLHVMDRYGQDHRGTHTILHGDFRNDNLMFGLDRVVVLDWQTVSLGAALSDVSYFLGGSLLPDLRRQHETGLVQLYWQRLVSLGVEMDWKDCWSGYRRFAFAGLIMAIFASMVVTPTKRGDDMFVAMADRAGLHALDMDALALIPKES